MAELNDANEANFVDADAHLRARCRQIAASGDATIEAAIEDVEDWYDRSLKLRVMENNTLRETIRETKACMEKSHRSESRWRTAAMSTFAVVGLVVAPDTAKILAKIVMANAHTAFTIVASFALGRAWRGF